MRLGAWVHLLHASGRRATVVVLTARALSIAGGSSYFDLFHYRDHGGMQVLTSNVGLEQGLAPNWLFIADILWDRIEMMPSPDGSTGGGHVHAAKRAVGASDDPDEVDMTSSDLANGSDAVSGASQRASSVDGGLVQHRYEGSVGLARQIGHGDKPHRLGGRVSISHEDDYFSMTGIADAAVELRQRNLMLSGHLGFGQDRIEPHVPPPGEQDRWPANQQRYLAGFGISQVMGRRSVVSATYGLAVQAGTLESPYRRSTVITTQFTENLPDTRWRHSAVLEWSFSLWSGLALHHREGAYYDSWNFHAWIPETALRWQFVDGFLLTLRHRHASQDAAEFWQHHYTKVEGYRSGDYRLAGLTQETVTGELGWSHPIGDRVLGLSGFLSRFWQRSQESGVHPEGYTLGASAKWAW